MNRVDLLHLIRAACDLLEVDEVLVLGSQAILATRAEDELPPQATLSREADIAAWNDPDESLSHLLAGVLGQDSAFDHVHGYYVDGVSAGTARLPLHWQQRAIRLESYSVVRNRTVVGVCPEANDLSVSKLCAFREKTRTSSMGFCGQASWMPERCSAGSAPSPVSIPLPWIAQLAGSRPTPALLPPSCELLRIGRHPLKGAGSRRRGSR
jgi:hypothetical protein